MKRVPHPPFAHPGCAVLTGRTRDDGGFVQTDSVGRIQNLDKPVLLSAEAVRIVAEQWGMVTREEVAGLREDLADANHRIAQLEQELNDATLDFQAIDRLESKGYQARKKVGRPRKAA